MSISIEPPPGRVGVRREHHQRERMHSPARRTARLPQEAKAESSQHLVLAFMYDCPRDSNTLMQHPPETGTAWRCNACSGAFLSALLTREVASRNLALGPREVWDLEVQCPKDGVRMQKVTAGSVAFDYCMACDCTWLDGEEVERLFAPPEAPRQFHPAAERLKPQSDSKDGHCSVPDILDPVLQAILEALMQSP